MKFKPTERPGGVVVELGPRETQLPPLTASEAAGALPVFRLKKILVPVDFSSCSKKALQYAIPLARQFEAELTLLYVMHSYASIPEMPTVEVESLEEVTAELKAFQAAIGPEVPSQILLRKGDPHLEIIDAAKELGIDLIILATHGRTGLTRVLLGSTAEKVVRHATCPVLVVREQEREFVASDVSGLAQEPASTLPQAEATGN